MIVKGDSNFNSIKVRLEHRVTNSQLGTLRFQFHKGAIRTKNSIFIESVLQEYFNSIKVRLEQPKHADDTSYFIFQFHKGAIRTELSF